LCSIRSGVEGNLANSGRQEAPHEKASSPQLPEAEYLQTTLLLLLLDKLRRYTIAHPYYCTIIDIAKISAYASGILGGIL
jgi:hypothetical protein